MPFKDPSRKKAWRAAYNAAGRHKPVEQRHQAFKASLGLERDEPIDPIKREQWRAKREAAKARASLPRVCVVCGGAFENSSPRARYCASCHPEAPKPRETRHCAICGEPFEAPIKSRRVACSKRRCIDENYLARVRAKSRRSRQKNGYDQKRRNREQIQIDALRKLGLADPPRSGRLPIDSDGLYIPHNGFLRRQIYDQYKAGISPREIAISVGCDLWIVTEAIRQKFKPRRGGGKEKPAFLASDRELQVRRATEKRYRIKRRATLEAARELGFLTGGDPK